MAPYYLFRKIQIFCCHGICANDFSCIFSVHDFHSATSANEKLTEKQYVDANFYVPNIHITQISSSWNRVILVFYEYKLKPFLLTSSSQLGKLGQFSHFFLILNRIHELRSDYFREVHKHLQILLLTNKL